MSDLNQGSRDRSFSLLARFIYFPCPRCDLELTHEQIMHMLMHMLMHMCACNALDEIMYATMK